MEKIEINVLKQFISSQGNSLVTKVRKKRFLIRLRDNQVEIIPESSGKLRTEPDASLLKVLEYFNNSGSLLSKDYHDITFNSVYLLACIEAFLIREN